MPAACRTISATGPVGDALAVREAPAADDAGPVADDPEELGHEAALAHAGRPRIVKSWHDPPETARSKACWSASSSRSPSDHRRIEAATVPLGPRGDVAQPVRDDRLRLALELDRLGRADLDRVAHELVRRAADDDLAGRGGGLEPGGDVDGVADDDRLARPARCRRRPSRC